MKGDKADVRQVCLLLRLGELKKVYHPQDDERAVFNVADQQCISLRDHETTMKRQIKAKYRGRAVIDVQGTCVYITPRGAVTTRGK